MTPSCSRGRVTISLVIAAAVIVGLGGRSRAVDQAAVIPAFFQRLDTLVGAHVVQKRGWVRDAEDVGDLLRNGYWILNDKSAIGVVRDFHDDGTLDVEFPNETGWSRSDFQVKKVERTSISYDSYGEALNVEEWTEEGVKIDPSEHGLIIAQEERTRTVRFPINCLALAPLKVGDRVTRGPDWNLDFNDGGESPAGPTSSEYYGEVVEGANSDNYVLVEWNKTGIRDRCRFDCRRRYDVLPISVMVGN